MYPFIFTRKYTVFGYIPHNNSRFFKGFQWLYLMGFNFLAVSQQDGRVELLAMSIHFEDRNMDGLTESDLERLHAVEMLFDQAKMAGGEAQSAMEACWPLRAAMSNCVSEASHASAVWRHAVAEAELGVAKAKFVAAVKVAREAYERLRIGKYKLQPLFTDATCRWWFRCP